MNERLMDGQGWIGMLGGLARSCRLGVVAPASGTNGQGARPATASTGAGALYEGGPSTHEVTVWRGLAAQIGEEIALPLTTALERVQQLVSTGRIDRNSLRALREELDRARRVGMSCQQIARLSTGRIKQSHERVHLHQLVQNVLATRARELQARGFAIRSVFKPVDVLVDPSLLFNLTNTLVDWAVDHASGEVELRVDLKTWPRHGRISLSFAPTQVLRTLATLDDEVPANRLDDVSWHLLSHAARIMELEVSRSEVDGRLSLSIEFPRTVDPELSDPAEVEKDFEVDEGLSSNSKLLAGSHVLVICTRREVRVDVRDALRDMGMVVDFVGSVDEAIDFCADALPHAIIVEAIAAGSKFDRFKAQLRAEVPDFPLVEISETGPDFEISGMDGRDMGCVNRIAVREALGPALIFEMTKSM